MDESEAERLYYDIQNAEQLRADEYEELTATIMEHKLRQSPETHTVNHDHELQCDFGEKQMDVVLQVGEGDDEATIIVECKGSGSPMEKDDLAAFAFYIEHSEADTGIYVARSGYRAGAEDVAAQCGIRLLQIDRITAYTGELTSHYAPYRHDIRVTTGEPEDWVNLTTIMPDKQKQLELPILDESGEPTGETIDDRLQEATEDGGTKIETDFQEGEMVEIEGVEYDLLGAMFRKQSEEVSTDIEIEVQNRVDIFLVDVLADKSEIILFDDIVHQFAAVETDG